MQLLRFVCNRVKILKTARPYQVTLASTMEVVEIYKSY